MAKSYHAVNRIEHGGEGGELTVFEPGDQVTGLSKDEMLNLWNAGVLEERDSDARPKDDRDARIADLEKQIEDLRAAQESEPEMEAAAERPLEEIPGAGTLFTATNATAAKDLEGTKADPKATGPGEEDAKEAVEEEPVVEDGTKNEDGTENA
jgi:hypothetical protein